MAFARFDTRYVYLSLFLGRRFFRFSVYFFFLCLSVFGRVRVWLFFIYMMSGRGCLLVTYLSRTELFTGRAIIRRRILEGCVKRGRVVGCIEVSGR